MATLLQRVGLIFLLLAFSGCAILRQSRGRQPDPLTQTVLTLDDGIHSLDSGSAKPKQILERVLSALPASNASSKRDLRVFLQRMPTPRVDFPCGADFIIHKARNELERIKDEVLNTSPQIPEPELCYAVPFAIDVIQKESQEGVLELYGYDFDRVPLEMVLIDGSNSFEDVSSALVLKSHSHLTVRLGAGGIRFTANSQKLGLVWGHLIRHSISIIQPSMPLCRSQLENVRIESTLKYAPPQISGGGDPGSETRILAKVQLQPVSNVLNASICLTVAEGITPRTFAGCTGERLFTNESDFVVERVVGNMQSQISFTPGPNQSRDLKNDDPNEPVARWTFTGIESSDHDHPTPEIEIGLNEVRVVVTDPEGCLSPIAYSEAKRTNVLSQSTLQRLDPALKAVDPLIPTLRPRFAPPVAPH